MLTPQQLVDEFKKSGEFDRLRRELFARFNESEEKEALMAKVKDIAKTRLEGDKGLSVRSTDDVLKDVLQELDRYPVVDRALEQYSYTSDPAFKESLSKSLKETLDATNKE